MMAETFRSLPETLNFLTSYFGELTTQEYDYGYVSSASGFFLLPTVAYGQKSRTIQPLNSYGDTKEGSVITLANTVAGSFKNHCSILKYIPKETDNQRPRTDIQYEVIGPKNPLHEHENGRFLDFNLMYFSPDKTLTVGTTSQKLHPWEHTHLMPIVMP